MSNDFFDDDVNNFGILDPQATPPNVMDRGGNTGMPQSAPGLFGDTKMPAKAPRFGGSAPAPAARAKSSGDKDTVPFDVDATLFDLMNKSIEERKQVQK